MCPSNTLGHLRRQVSTCITLYVVIVLEANRGTYFVAGSVSELPTLDSSATGRIRQALEIEVSCGLILRDKDDSLRFEHHRILEYLAATYRSEENTPQLQSL